MTIKKIPAPDWFVSMWEDAERIMVDLGRPVGVGVDWIYQAGHEKFWGLARSKLNRQQLKELEMMSHYGSAIKKMAWARWQYENRENQDVLFADIVDYDREAKTILVKRGILDYVFDKFRSLAEEVNKKIKSKDADDGEVKS